MKEIKRLRWRKIAYLDWILKTDAERDLKSVEREGGGEIRRRQNCSSLAGMSFFFFRDKSFMKYREKGRALLTRVGAWGLHC